MKLYKEVVEVDEKELAQKALDLFLEDYASDIVYDVIDLNVDTLEISDEQIRRLRDEVLRYLDGLQLPN